MAFYNVLSSVSLTLITEPSLHHIQLWGINFPVVLAQIVTPTPEDIATGLGLFTNVVGALYTAITLLKGVGSLVASLLKTLRDFWDQIRGKALSSKE
jgi:hypothetical protein